MVNVQPFKAYRFNDSKAGKLENNVAPPYDVIKGDMIDRFQSLSEYNIAWITKNKPEQGDTSVTNQYTRARDHFNRWLRERILEQDDDPSFYIYGQDFEINAKNLFRFGFIGLIELEEFARNAPEKGIFAGVLQHEETLPKDIEDRLNLCRNCMANFGQIFVIYSDHEKKIDVILERNMKNSPIGDLVDGDGIRHRLWRISKKDDIEAISEAMKDKYIIIADGHHRYKTALALSEENPTLGSAKYRMLTFVNISNPGLVVLPTHRLVQNLDHFDKEKLLQDIRVHFDLEVFSGKQEMFQYVDMKFKEKKHSFGLFMNDGNFYAFTLKDSEVMDRLLPDKSPALRKLDVSILHTLVFDKMLGIDKEKLAQGTVKGGGYVIYVKGIGDAVDEAIQSVKSGAQAVFFMNPTRLQEVEAVSKNYEVMPQKSTFFHPKVWTGFTINKLL
jgi:uncharacterized protein (DUF1015 family)